MSADGLPAAIDSLSEAVFTLDREERITSVGGRWPEENAFPPEVVVGKTPSEILGAEAGAVHHENARCALGGARVVYPWSVETPRGLRSMETSMAPLRNRDGEVTGVVGISRDVTELRQAEEVRRRVDAELARLQRLDSLRHLAGGVAHDLNNRLMTILGFADLASDGLPADSPAREALAEVVRATERASSLARILLGYAGRGPQTSEPMRLDHVVAAMVGVLHSRVAMRASLVQELEEAVVLADRAQVEQAIAILVTNAAEALPPRGGTITLRTALRRFEQAELASPHLRSTPPAGEYAVLEVEDDGPGMDAATLERVFEPFFSTKAGAKGLGLTAVSGFIEAHHGSVGVWSEPGRGTRVRLLFPIGEPTGRTESSVRSATGGCVLLVDDDPHIRRLCQRALEKAGLEVVSTEGGREALDRHAELAGRIQVAVVDWKMPEVDGEAVVAGLRRLEPTLPLVVMSGLTEPAFVGAADGSPIVFLQKPFPGRRLVETVAALLPQADAGR